METIIQKHLANLLTILRMLLALGLLWSVPLSGWFFLFYLLGGITDLLDGPIARHTGSQSRFGAALDSAADTWFICILLGRLLPALELENGIWYWIGGILLLRCLSLLIGAIRFRQYLPMHTNFNKATGFALFCLPLLLQVCSATISCAILCGLASLSAVEELLIQLFSEKPDREIRGILFLSNKPPLS